MVAMFSKLAAVGMIDVHPTTPGDFIQDDQVCEDECETGYPKSASHLFLRTLEYCERTYPGRPILFCEPDTTPTRPGWFREIAEEYQGCGRAFMSQRIIHPAGGGQHLMGNAVYAADWRARAPRMLTAPTAPDNALWGPGRGQPWDVWAGKETTADMHESSLFQQIFTCLPWTADNLNRLERRAALFHRSKDGTLIAQLTRDRFPGFVEALPTHRGFYQMLGHPSRLACLGYPQVGRWHPVMRPTGWLSVCHAADPLEEMILRCLVGCKGISTITREEFNRLSGQVPVAAAAD